MGQQARSARAAKLLKATLAEEKKTDQALTKLATSIVNDMAEPERRRRSSVGDRSLLVTQLQ